MKSFVVPMYIKEALEKLKPPEKITVSEWAERHRRLDSKTSAIPGTWCNSVTPYLAEIMNEFNNYTTEEIVFTKPTQVGGTEAILNCLGFCIDQDPAPMMVVYPTDDLAKSISKNRIQDGLVKLSDTISKKFAKDSPWNELQFDSMYLTIEGSNSPSKLASKPIRYLFLDEVDKYPGATVKEAEPISLARERTKTFHNRKIFMTSTPTLKTGHIWKALESCDAVKHYFVPCPRCGAYIELKFSQIKFPSEEKLSYIDRAEMATYVCQECGGIIRDSDKSVMLNCGKWEVVSSRTKTPSKIGFWLSTLYSPFVRFSEIVKEFLISKDDPERLQNFINSWLAEPWEDTKLRVNSYAVLEKQTDYEQFTVPEDALLLTGGIDVQHGCLYWTIRAWGSYLTSYNIAHGQAMSFAEVERVMNLEYQKESGEKMVVNLCLVDSGDQTDAVYDFCAYNSEWALPVKGSSYDLTTHYKISKVNKIDSRAFGMQLVIVDSGKYKDMIAGRLQRPIGTGSWMVYKGCDREYAEQVASEHKISVRSKNGTPTTRWVTKTTHAANHYLDAEVYAFAAADILGARTLHLQMEGLTAQTNESSETIVKEQDEQKEEKWISKYEGWI